VRPVLALEACELPLILHRVEEIYELLVSGDYEALESMTRGLRLSAEDVRVAVHNYPYVLRRWPSGQPMFIDVVEVTGSNPKCWSIRADAYTDEEGRSDLSMELTLIESHPGELDVEFDGLHVL
jgi:hypothetical protein